MSLAFHVRSWRKRLGWSRKTAADKLGVSVHTIKSYELCRRELPVPVRKLMTRLEEEMGVAENSSEDTVIIGGGFISDTKNDDGFSYVYPCFGQTSKALLSLYQAYEKSVTVIYSKMANPESKYETSQDLKNILTMMCERNNIKMIHLACTNTDFDAAEYIKTQRPDITVVGYTAVEHNDKEKFLKHCDFSFVAQTQKDAETQYFSYEKENKPVLNHADKEIVLAGLIECIMHSCTKHLDREKEDTDRESFAEAVSIRKINLTEVEDVKRKVASAAVVNHY